jgi:hypothetical protein
LMSDSNPSNSRLTTDESRLTTSDSSGNSPDSRPTTHDSAAAAAAFRARLEAGDYRALLGRRLGEVMAEAAGEAGVGDELGALRVVMARLLTEEEDLVVLAPLVARIASVSIQAARAQRAISGQLAESLTEALTSILTTIEGGEG